jgi:hypothetical protein
VNTTQAQAEVSKWERKIGEFERALAEAARVAEAETGKMGAAILDGADPDKVSEKVSRAETKTRALQSALGLARENLGKASADLLEAKQEEGRRLVAQMEEKTKATAIEILRKAYGLLETFWASAESHAEIMRTQSAHHLPGNTPNYAFGGEIRDRAEMLLVNVERSYPDLFVESGVPNRIAREAEKNKPPKPMVPYIAIAGGGLTK